MSYPLIGVLMLGLSVGANADSSETIGESTQWTIFGTFPNPDLTQPSQSGATRKGFDDDFLKSIGGETNPNLPDNQLLKVKAVRAVAEANGFVNIGPRFDITLNQVAYAYTSFESDGKDQLQVLFGSDDGAKVWLNGKLVHSKWTPGRASIPGEDRFTIQPRKGANNLLVKIENAGGDWCFNFESLNPEQIKERDMAQARQHLDLLDIIQPGNETFLLTTSDLPSLEWKLGPILDNMLGSTQLRIRWFDAEAREVLIADRPGRYVAYCEAVTKDGHFYKRFVPFCRLDLARSGRLMDTFNIPFEGKLSNPVELGLSGQVWKNASSVFQAFVTRKGRNALLTTPDGAVVLSYLLELNGKEGKITDPYAPFLKQAEVELAIKRKLLGISGNPFKAPQKLAKPMPVIRLGTVDQAGMKPGTVEKLNQLCEEWTKAEGMPFTCVVARHGVVFHRSAYGILSGKKISSDEPFWPASIGKTICGMMFAQFMDQGLLDPEMPIGKILTDFPITGDKAVTFRNLFTHTSGIAGHGTYGGLWNTWLDNSFASQRLPSLEVGLRHNYGGDGNNIGAKAMELIVGKPFVQMMRDYLFTPLGTKIDQDDLGWINRTTAYDLAKVGQLMLNRGSYGQFRFFSPETFAKVLPVRLADYNPKLNDKSIEWGLCLTWSYEPEWSATNVEPRKNSYLGPNVIGHGSASSSIFRVDLDNGFVIVMGRYGQGNTKAFMDYKDKFMKLLKDSIAK